MNKDQLKKLEADLWRAADTYQREIDPSAAQFMRVMNQLQPINQETFNDEKFALAA